MIILGLHKFTSCPWYSYLSFELNSTEHEDVNKYSKYFTFFVIQFHLRHSSKYCLVPGRWSWLQRHLLEQSPRPVTQPAGPGQFWNHPGATLQPGTLYTLQRVAVDGQVSHTQWPQQWGHSQPLSLWSGCQTHAAPSGITKVGGRKVNSYGDLLDIHFIKIPPILQMIYYLFHTYFKIHVELILIILSWYLKKNDSVCMR